MANDNERLETGVFQNSRDAEVAVTRLHELGYRKDEISVMMSDATRARDFALETHSKSAEGTTAGGIIGGTLGGIAAAMTTVIAGTVITGGAALPLMAGPIAAILAGIGAGGVAGGIIGALVGAGIPETQAREIEGYVNQGAIVIGVTPTPQDRKLVREILNGHGGTARVSTGDIEPRETRSTT